jgi:RNA polymerase sigma-70 factor (ECF subfamily)
MACDPGEGVAARDKESVEHRRHARWGDRHDSSLCREDADTARLVERLQAGERQVFDTLYRRYFDRVHGYLRAMLQSRDDADDATQDVFLAVIVAIDRYERRSVPFRAWLFRIARNAAIDHKADRRRQCVTGPQEVSRLADLTGAKSYEPPVEKVEDGELLEHVKTLSPPQRQVIALRYLLGLRAVEIAAVMNRSPEAIRQVHQRARRTLRCRVRGRRRGRCSPLPLAA